MNANDPAFPFHYKDFQPNTGSEVTREQWGGLSKREYFAGLAMQAWITDNAKLDDCSGAASWAVGYADALLAELERTEPKEQV